MEDFGHDDFSKKKGGGEAERLMPDVA